MKTAIYLRISTSSQSFDSQEKALLEFCSQKGIEEYVVYRDEGYSGTSANRPGLDTMMSDCRSGQIGCVVVFAFSRFARSVRHLCSALEEFRTLGISFISITENIDTASPLGEALFYIIGALSSLERQLIVERVRSGLKAAKDRGTRLGRRRTRNDLAIRALAAQGNSQSAIAKILGCSRTTVKRSLLEAATNAAGSDFVSSKAVGT